MEVKPGYKHTEVGVIPEDWECKQIGELTAYTNGAAHEKSVTEYGKYTVVNSKFISTAGNIRKYSNECLCEAATGDVLMVMSDVPNGRAIAKCFLVERDHIYTVNQRICILRPRKINDRLLFYKLDRNPFYLAFDDGAKQTNLRKADVLSCPIGIPPTEAEQKAIAQVLADVDALLNALDRLIAKKRDIKQAAMQQLLTGQTRLPGFCDDWEVKTLGEISEMGSGGTPTSSVAAYYDGDIPWISISDMTKGGKFINATERNLTRAGFASSAAQMFPVGTVLYAMYASLGECSIAGISLCSSQAILGIRPGNNLSNEFLYYYLISLKPFVKSLGQQGTQSNLNKGMVQGFQLRLPELPEQKAIAQVLAEMDEELAALEQRRAKTRALKQGMMQELLTGKTRLVAAGETHG